MSDLIRRDEAIKEIKKLAEYYADKQTTDSSQYFVGKEDGCYSAIYVLEELKSAEPKDNAISLLPSGELLVDTKHANEAKSVRLMDREGFTRVFEEPKRWIPCEERMPAEPEGSYGCIALIMDTDIRTGEEFENILPYPVGYDGKIWIDYEGCECPYKVIAWMPLPNPYEDGKE